MSFLYASSICSLGDLLFGFVEERRKADLQVLEGQLVRLVKAGLIDVGIGIAILAFVEQLLHLGRRWLALHLARRTAATSIG